MKICSPAVVQVARRDHPHLPPVGPPPENPGHAGPPPHPARPGGEVAGLGHQLPPPPVVDQLNSVPVVPRVLLGRRPDHAVVTPFVALEELLEEGLLVPRTPRRDLVGFDPLLRAVWEPELPVIVVGKLL